MESQGRDDSPEESRTAALGRKHARQPSEEKDPEHDAQESNVPLSRPAAAKKARTGDDGEWGAEHYRIEIDTPTEHSPIPTETFDRDPYAGLPHDSNRLLAELGQQDNNVDDAEQRRLGTHVVNPLPSESVPHTLPEPEGAAHTSKDLHEHHGEEHGHGGNISEATILSGYSVTDEDRTAIKRREEKRTKKNLLALEQDGIEKHLKLAIRVDLPGVADVRRAEELPHHILRSAIEYHIARYSLKGFKTILYPTGDIRRGGTAEDPIDAVLCYDPRVWPTAAVNLQCNPLVVNGNVTAIAIKELLQFVCERWYTPGDLWKRFIDARADAVVARLESGELNREGYGALRKSKPKKKKKQRLVAEPLLNTDQDVSSISGDIPGLNGGPNISNSNSSGEVTQAQSLSSNAEGCLARCQICMREGHPEEDCPSKTCVHCQARDQHYSNACPTRWRCRRCRQLGHLKGTCRSTKTVSVKNMVCDLCHNTGHPEDRCFFAWRTFIPETIPNLKKIEELVESCYRCGSDWHWGNDCPQSNAQAEAGNTLSTTFSSADASYFLRQSEDADAMNDISTMRLTRAASVADSNATGLDSPEAQGPVTSMANGTGAPQSPEQANSPKSKENESKKKKVAAQQPNAPQSNAPQLNAPLIEVPKLSKGAIRRMKKREREALQIERAAMEHEALEQLPGSTRQPNAPKPNGRASYWNSTPARPTGLTKKQKKAVRKIHAQEGEIARSMAVASMRSANRRH